MENMLPLISVIIPVYNVEKYLKRCMDSVLNQTYTNLDIVLVDDGSTDKSGDLCDEYQQIDSRVRVIHKKNGGLSDARNIGIENARGEYLTFVDSDDELVLDCVEYLYRLICKYNCSISSCAAQVIIEKNRKVYKNKLYTDEILSAHNGLKNMLYQKGIGVSAWGKLYKKELFSKTGIRYPIGKFAEDTGTTYKFLLIVPAIAWGYQCKYKYWIRENSLTTSSFTPKHFDLIELADNMVHDIYRHFPDLQNATLAFQMFARFSTLNRLLRSNDNYEKEKGEIIRFIKTNGGEVLKDTDAPRITKIATLLLKISPRLYGFCWNAYCWVKKDSGAKTINEKMNRF